MYLNSTDEDTSSVKLQTGWSIDTGNPLQVKMEIWISFKLEIAFMTYMQIILGYVCTGQRTVRLGRR
jgi:hypothetical protein